MPQRGKLLFRSRYEEALRETWRAWEQATRETAPEIEDAIKASVSQSYPPASKPGRLPHLRTGQLRDGVKVYGGKALTVRTTAPHGGFVNNGTVNMAARDYVNRQFQGSLGVKWARRIGSRVQRITGRTRKR